MLYMLLGITAVLILVPVLFEAVTRGWRETIIARAGREIPHLARPEQVGSGHGVGSQSSESYSILTLWLLILFRSVAGLLFGAGIGALISIFGYGLTVKLVSPEHAYWLSGLLGELAAGFTSAEVTGQAQKTTGAITGLATPFVVIEFLRWNEYSITFPWWLIAIQLVLAIPIGIFGSRLSAGRRTRARTI